MEGIRYTEGQKKEFSDFMAKLPTLSDEDLGKQCEQFIWLSAYAANNPRSNYHRMCDACYDECQKREKLEIYNIAYKRIKASI